MNGTGLIAALAAAGDALEQRDARIAALERDNAAQAAQIAALQAAHATATAADT